MTYTFKQLNLGGIGLEHNGDFHELKHLHNTLFPNTDASFEWFKWYFSLAKHTTQVATTRVYGAYHGKELVGMWCVEPKAFRSSYDTMLVGRAFATGIRADHRRSGLFTELSTFAIVSERTLNQYRWIFGFPQVGRPVINAHLKSGWQHLQTIQALGFTPKKPVVSLSNVKVNDWSIQCSSQGDYMGTFIERHPYKKARWNEHPDHVYTTLSFDEKASRSSIVLKHYASSMHVLDLNGGSSAGAATVLRAAQSLAYRHKAAELTIWCAENEADADAIINVCGFDAIAKATPCIEVLVASIASNDISELKTATTHFQMGVEEGY